MPMDLVSEPELFAQQEKINQEYATQGYAPLDPLMRPVVERLNSIHGVFTTASCSSHPEEGMDRLYVAALVSPSGLGKFSQVYVQLVEELLESDETAIWARQANMSVRYRFPNGIKTRTFVWTINVPCGTERLRTLFIDAFTKAIDNVIHGSGAGSIHSQS